MKQLPKKKIPSVPFPKLTVGLTTGQIILYNMLIDHIASNKVITRANMAKCYIKAVHPSGKIIRWRWKVVKGKDVWTEFEEDIKATDPLVFISSLQWFKSNMATCIIKGKLLVIPPIEL